MITKRNCFLIGEGCFHRKAEISRTPRKLRKLQQGKGWKGVSWARNWWKGSVLNVKCKLHRKERSYQNPAYGNERWNEREEMEELLWRENIDEKTITSICACGCVGEAKRLRTWTPGPVFLCTDFNFGLIRYVTLVKFPVLFVPQFPHLYNREQ